jgi:L-fuculose-phosphate aldolase
MLTEMCNVMAEAYRRGWITVRDGNVSFRRKDSNYLYITPSGVRKNVLKVEDIVKLKLNSNGLTISTGQNPSGELHMHLRLHTASNRTLTVLHLHPTFVLSAMLRGFKLNKLADLFPELGRYTKVGPDVPVLPITSKELGDATFDALSLNYDIVGQHRHGICAVARDPWAAFEHVERLSHVCEFVVRSGISPNDL